MTELDLQSTVLSILERDGWAVSTQWRIGSKRVDIVASRGGEVHSYEVKLRDWRRGSKQAFLNGPYFNRCYVVLPSNVRRRLDSDLFRELEVGLLELAENGAIIHVVEPPRRDLTPAMSTLIGQSGSAKA